jgi:hypothetical protein
LLPRGHKRGIPFAFDLTNSKIRALHERLAALKRSTVTAIDDRRTGQGARLQFLNSSLLENRETHDLEMLLTLYGQDPDPAKAQSADGCKYVLRLK